jgi:hypothetical protein
LSLLSNSASWCLCSPHNIHKYPKYIHVKPFMICLLESGLEEL